MGKQAGKQAGDTTDRDSQKSRHKKMENYSGREYFDAWSQFPPPKKKLSPRIEQSACFVARSASHEFMDDACYGTKVRDFISTLVLMILDNG